MSEASLPEPRQTPLAGSIQNRMTEDPANRWDKVWVWVGEHTNPIVVKEVRQSLKSRQFTMSFGLTLIAAISWTFIAVSLNVPRIYYIPGGLSLLAGYVCILTLPLMVIIPFSTFRSLTAETEDGTFELLSISALSALQIVHGKMASACLQMILYLSALAPCMVLTYLLRGVSLFMILFVIGLTVSFSLCENALALLLAAVSRSRMVQNAVSILVLAGLLIASFAWILVIFDQGLNEFSNPPKEIYLVLFAIGTILAIAFSLVLHAAAAAIDFPSENHSTPLRWRILGLVALVLFWSIAAIVGLQEASGAVLLLVGVFVFMMAIGALITGEHGIISPRAQRTLPKSFAGRVFLTWLYPGAGLGYLFVVSVYGGLVVTLSSLEVYYVSSLDNWFGRSSVVIAGYLLLCYLTFYLGLNRLLLLLFPKTIPSRMLSSFCLLTVTLLFAHLIPLILVYYWNDYREFDYGWHQALNIWWTADVALNDLPLRNSVNIFSSEIGLSIALVTLCAISIFGLNLSLCTRDVLLVRVAQPPRVLEEIGLASTTPPEQVDPFSDEPGDSPFIAVND